MSDASASTAWTWLAPLLPGCAHAVTTVFVGFPFDMVKTRLQVGMHSSVVQCIRSTVTQEGPLAFYRGSLMPLAALVTKRPLEFAAFEWCNKAFGEKAKGPFVGGFVAGIISAAMGCPFNVVKVQMQANRSDTYKHTMEAISQVWRSKGLLGFYNGLGASFIYSVPATTFYLGSYGVLREALPQSSWSPAVAGSAASLSMWTCMLPLDNVRTVIQAAPVTSDAVRVGWWSHFVGIVRQRGILGLWAGWTAVAARAPIMSGCSMLAYEQARLLVDTAQKGSTASTSASRH